MCGFVGGTEAVWDYDAAAATLRHRGPDAGAVRRTDALSIGFPRRQRGFNPPRRYIDALRSSVARQEFLLRTFLDPSDSHYPPIGGA